MKSDHSINTIVHTLWNNDKSAVVAVLLFLVLGFGIDRYWGYRCASKEYVGVPGFVRAIYARKLEVTGSTGFAKRAINMHSEQFGITFPYLFSHLIFDPLMIIISILLFLREGIPAFLLALVVGIAGLHLLYSLVRVIIPGVFMKKYWQS